MLAYSHVPLTALILALSLSSGALRAAETSSTKSQQPAKAAATTAKGAPKSSSVAAVNSYLDWIRQTERKRAALGASIDSAKDHTQVIERVRTFQRSLAVRPTQVPAELRTVDQQYRAALTQEATQALGLLSSFTKRDLDRARRYASAGTQKLDQQFETVREGVKGVGRQHQFEKVPHIALFGRGSYYGYLLSTLPQ